MLMVISQKLWMHPYSLSLFAFLHNMHNEPACRITIFYSQQNINSLAWLPKREEIQVASIVLHISIIKNSNQF